MNIYHNSQNLTYRKPFGAVTTGTSVYLAIKASGARGVLLSFARDGEEPALIPMHESEHEMGFFELDVEMPQEPGICWYHFVVDLGSNRYYYGNASDGLGGEGSLSNLQVNSYQITVYEEETVPKWYKDGIVYQIFPDRFARGRDWQECVVKSAHPSTWQGPKRVICQDWSDKPFYTKDANGAVTRWPFFGGNLSGIIEKIPYLKSLGVTVLYLNPIFEASSNHRYDTADYMKIDPMLGDENTFRELASACDDAGIKIILDGVFNHTGRDSKYFNYFTNYGNGGAYWDQNSPYRLWYRFTDENPGYECWWGVHDLPNIEENSPSYQDFICGENGVVRHWLKNGASGWRLDVVDELPDFFVEKIRAAAKAENPNSLLMGEVWEDATSKVAYGERRRYFLGKELDCTMHYPFKEAAIDFCMGKLSADDFARRMMNIYENYPRENFYSCLNLVGSHDCARILSVLGEAENIPENEREDFRLSEWYYSIGIKREKLINALRFMMPGVPCIYYGDEVGMQGLEDPYNRGTFPWGNEDPDILANYRAWAKFYHANPVLKDGEFKIFTVNKECVGIARFYYGRDFRSNDVVKYAAAIVNRSLTQEAVFKDHKIPPLGVLILDDDEPVTDIK